MCCFSEYQRQTTFCHCIISIVVYVLHQVQEASANAAAAQLLAEEANAVKQAKSKKAKKERQKAKKQQQQQQQQSIMQALQNEAAQTEVPGKPQELEDANRGDAVVQQAVQGLTGSCFMHLWQLMHLLLHSRHHTLFRKLSIHSRAVACRQSRP